MPLTGVPDLPADAPQPATGLTFSSLIDEIVRAGARTMLAAALPAEVDAAIAAFADERDEQGRRLLVRNGYHAPRAILTAAGAIEVKAPRVNDTRIDETTGERKRFSSTILPPWCRTTPKVTQVLPLLYLDGLSSGDVVPALAVGDGALDCWVVLREGFPQAGEQRCWCHKIATVVGALPKSAPPSAQTALTEIWKAEDKDHALKAVTACEAADWVPLRTTTPIESTFATVRHRTKVPKGPGSRPAGLVVAFTLIESAPARGHAVNASHLVALVRAETRSGGGRLVEREELAA